MFPRLSLKKKSTEELLKTIEHFGYSSRGDAIGNNEIAAEVFLILHERKEVDCETAYCFEGCEEKNILYGNH